MKDWQEWHTEYEDPDSKLSRRRRLVQEHIRRALDATLPGPIRAISMCAGDGQDLLGVLHDHPRRYDVVARLVEWDPGLADRARAAAPPGIDVRTGDAALFDNYAEFLPADLVLSCGIFGNITDEDIHRTIDTHPALCAPGATVIWTRHRREPDLVPQICDWFADAGFEPIWISEPDLFFGVGVHRFVGQPQPAAPGTHMFTFS